MDQEFTNLTLDDYQRLANFTLIYTNEELLFHYAALGLNGEAGEVAEHAKKSMRDDNHQITEERREQIVKELGDVLWYVALCCSALDLSMGDVAAINLAKLKSREQRGVLGGSGDNR